MIPYEHYDTNIMKYGKKIGLAVIHWRRIRFDRLNGGIWALKFEAFCLNRWILNFPSQLFSLLTKSASKIQYYCLCVISMWHRLTTYNHVYSVQDNKRPRRDQTPGSGRRSNRMIRQKYTIVLYIYIYRTARRFYFVSCSRRPGDSGITDNFNIPLSFRRRSPPSNRRQIGFWAEEIKYRIMTVPRNRLCKWLRERWGESVSGGPTDGA